MGSVEKTSDLSADYDPVDFAGVYDYYLYRIYKYICYRIGNLDEAEDLTSKVFELTLKNIKNYKPERATFATWLYTIANNTLTDYLRSLSRCRFISLELVDGVACAGHGPEEAAICNERREELFQALSCLNDRQRNIISLKFAFGLNNKEISEITGLTRSNVAVIIYRALQRMRSNLVVKE
ncbi:RNA polymerase, sigma-24 subunit, ECF subfamily [Desulfofarcimen acetoxidans DSM 771]|jgi:RNA polymerase sigma-70 factor (ECF subfamily)|uniref:RNA polymerase, sigma-24 subunit, ECF subfamily n=1 Tax=Desulfofarcimen acetoxidans (strain ATCC 49208 / DSM 771 / KCTC 5769 / VKM B-1644 / 5575) TaxID=485916 RepID=C8W361_DESAS|nr:sigma-70 family RNA polymerase sigma factor [Desulfofarcimen acetoxidans]ACV61828.1 RNA polymerase, sigma-24 subunit, ECF subfamily [Desulfofarcimen acetoxidans DSM 771]